MQVSYNEINSRKEKSYSPLMYLHKIKRPGENYIVKTILLDDLPLLFFAFAGLGTDFVYRLIGIVLLTFSFWCVYDYGYYENDYVGAKYEKDPVLSDNYHSELAVIKWWQPWLWTLLFSILGVAVLKANAINFDLPFNDGAYPAAQNTSTYLFLWLGFLMLSRAVFYVYNHVNKQSRIWLYPLLQFSRYCGLLVLLPTNLIGACAILGQVFARSLTYTVYRHVSKNDWPKLQDWFLRWLLFAMILAMIACAQSSMDIIFNWQTLAISGWWLFRCRKQISQILNSVEPIWNNA